MILMATLLLVVGASDGEELRLASTGTGSVDVVWSLDGAEVARTEDGRAATLRIGPGTHELYASSASRAAWVAMARPDSGGDALGYRPAWVARAEATPAAGTPWAWPSALAGAALALGAFGRRRKPARVDPAMPPPGG